MCLSLRTIVLAIWTVLAGAAPLAHGSESEGRRAIILGFDGVDPRLVARYMAEGDLPHIKALAAEGTLLPLATTNPAESPVSWAAMSVGGNPGHSGIFDFLRRIPDTYVPEIALATRAERAVLPHDWQRAGSALAAALLIIAFLWIPSRLLLRKAHRARRIADLAALLGAALLAYAGYRWLEHYIPRSIPVPVATRQGTPYWQHAGACGIECTILHMPVTFPARAFPLGRLLSGLGTPDVRGTWGTFSVFASRFPQHFIDPVNALSPDLRISGRATSVTGGRLYQLLLPEGDVARIQISLPGPENFTEALDSLVPGDRRREVECKVAVEIDRNGGTVLFDTGLSRARAGAGEWTGWLEVDYVLNPVFRVRGIVRFLVRSITPDLYVYATPVNFHPAAPPAVVALSTPAGYSRELVERSGTPYATLGWATPTNPLKDELLTEDEFLDDMERNWDERWRLMSGELARADWRLFTGVLLPTDRVQHMFWRFEDPRHPLYDAAAPAHHRNAIRDIYRRMDQVVGEVMAKHLDGRTDLWVLSDHGFASFRTGVNVNSWLVDEGFMVLKAGARREAGRLEDITRGSDPFGSVDWSRTRAYSFGLGKIYLNLRGREPQGMIESPFEAERALGEIRDRLLALRDPATGGAVVRAVYRGAEIYRGPHAAEGADIIIGFEEGYRVSWDTAAGRAPAGVLVPNLNKWSGDHCSVDPPLVPGVLVTNRKLAIDDPSVIDVAPSALAGIGVPPHPEMEGRNLLAD